ncbi:hypothetical protein AYL99_08745 [Fonsecaea erecta]|uniref:Zn(2)-C6 fungal-type domain-containing protein n=1 Tax=Fonsecaea erecta TaxID=1367422 RepID=A0A178ZBR8_9EURO|nr:hypothetical protein AYL99_08745 [Fonsecaea erecta]OAP56633.1 hypothetical protein AYL99_08745 [Fonsecaea erecta]
MPNRREAQDLKPPPRPGSGEPAKSRVRIGRACDRCKIKKSKCDGNTPCSACISSESTCEYSARRRREARDWYWGMQDVIDEALQRLYWACREGRGFPGVIPDESAGRVSTDAILRGLGLSPPPVDNTRLAASRSDSILETQEQLHRPQLYRPPDFLPPDSSRTKATSSGMTPLSTTSDERLTFGGEAATDGTNRRGQQVSAMEVDGEEEEMSEGLPDSLAAGFGEQFQGSIGRSIDPAMLQDGHVDLTDGDLYPNMSVMNFAGGQPGIQGQRMPTQAAAPQFQVGGLPQETYGGAGEQRWQGQGQGHQVDGLLPWPGNMVSMYGRTAPDDGRGGFDDHGDRER